jgi:hypothetical protein
MPLQFTHDPLLHPSVSEEKTFPERSPVFACKRPCRS